MLATLLLVYFAAAVVMLTVRFWVIPRIDEWRPAIEHHLSSDLGMQVKIGSLAAGWAGLSPTLTVQDLTMRDEQDADLLRVPHAFASVSWQSLMNWDLRLQRLEINGIDLSVSRDAQGALSVAGIKIESHPDSKIKFDADTPLVHWLLSQGKVQVSDAIIRWSDAQRNAPEFVLTKVDFALNNGLFTHRFLMNAKLPDNVGNRFELIVQTNHLFNQIASKNKREAEVYAEIQDLEPLALAPWLDVPAVKGRFAARTWIDVADGKLGQTIFELSGNKPGFLLPDDTSGSLTGFDATKFDLRMTGLLSDFLPQSNSDYLLIGQSGQPIKTTVSFNDLNIESSFFEPSKLALGSVKSTLQLFKSSDAIDSLKIDSLQIDQTDLQLNLAGSWKASSQDHLGMIDLKASFPKLSAPSLHQYLTPVIDVETRHWLRDALTKGQFEQLTFTMNGGLSQVPFNQPDQTGVFDIQGRFQDLSIDYGPPQAKELGWPPLIEATGRIALNKLALSLDIDSATLLGTKGERVDAKLIQAKIPDLMLKPVLSISTQTEGQAEDYLGVLRHTPLNAAIGDIFDKLGATGLWKVPLELEIDLEKPDETKAKGQIVFAGSSVNFGEDLPKLENIQGTLDFSNAVFRANKISARFLGGDIVIDGVVGEPEGKIIIEGNAIVDGMREYANLPALSVLKGRTKYRAQIAQNNKEGVDVSLTTSLEGLAVALPAPLGKVATDKAPLTFRWSSQKQKNDYRHSIYFSLGELINGRLERAAGFRGKSYFSQAVIAMGTQAELPSKGMKVDLALGPIEWSDWSDLIDRVSADKKSKSGVTTTPIFPPIDRFSLKSPRLVFDELVFSDLTVSGSQPDIGQWQVLLRSEETEGSFSWQLASGALAGRVRAKFSKLELGAPSTSAEVPPKIQNMNESQWSDIPAIDLIIDDFKLYGSRLGSLYLRGDNIQRGQSWNIESLEIKNPFAKLNAKGQWRLKGGNRGIHLDADLAISDLGKLSELMGHVDRVRDGKGTIKAQINWINFPWVFSYEGMNGKATIDLEKGVFEHVNSRSARLLELLSLQSLQRILSFNFSPGNAFKDGYPWNEISGSFEIEEGVASTSNLVVASPVATISMVGSSDLNHKTWNMDADVKPRFDMSGTAVATGFVVNPIVGVSALVTQFLLRNPIERAMTVKYQVRGPWDDPTLEPIEAPKVAPPEGSLFSNGGN